MEAAVAALKPGDVLLLENVRFHAEEESKDDAVRLPFAQQLAKLGDVYVNDAFGTAHRDHASTASIARFLRPAVAGYLMAKEIHTLGHALENPARPFVTILGGAKVKDKLKLIKNMIGKVDALLVGGGMAFTFYQAMGYEVGRFARRSRAHRRREGDHGKVRRQRYHAGAPRGRGHHHLDRRSGACR